MQTLLFFSRASLSKLYGSVSRYLKDVEVVHVAYSQSEVNILRSFGIEPDYVYLDLFKREYDNVVVNDEILLKIDNTIIEQSEGRFNLNSAIQSDRGFSILTYEECLQSVISHFNVWENIFKEHHIDVLEHEPCSLFFNYIASILCKRQGGAYTYQLAIKNDESEYAFINANGGDYKFYELQHAYNKYLNNPSLIDRERCSRFVKVFREDRTVFMGKLLQRKVSLFKLFAGSLREKWMSLVSPNRYDRIYSNIEYWVNNKRVIGEKFNNIKDYRARHIRFESSLPVGEKFYFYPFHLEPEAVVQYLADGIYKNQVKLIENIAASLPPGYYLYVKDHPHEFAYRKADDYERLLNIPNIRLLDSNIPGKEIIMNSIGVVTINSTAGFEALLMGKQVYCFGTCMYSFVPRVHYIKNIRDLREAMYKEMTIAQYRDDVFLEAYIMAVLTSSYPGYIDGFVGGAQIPNMDLEKNAQLIATGLEQYVKRISELINEYNEVN